MSGEGDISVRAFDKVVVPGYATIVCDGLDAVTFIEEVVDGLRHQALRGGYMFVIPCTRSSSDFRAASMGEAYCSLNFRLSSAVQPPLQILCLYSSTYRELANSVMNLASRLSLSSLPKKSRLQCCRQPTRDIFPLESFA